LKLVSAESVMVGAVSAAMPVPHGRSWTLERTAGAKHAQSAVVSAAERASSSAPSASSAATDGDGAPYRPYVAAGGGGAESSTCVVPETSREATGDE
jgi:hypothetical protein